eukprot:CAMPEP_0114268464 /NCGR_PEP_ID=MMETSP0058-20121206/25964_1 /TAXON_ID=36894 /ORGANISM="Pyramimonas parkeae, CCMP726" /LENGTH=42 /DNA_ID= /DNA_START= /DNA_END= /DNA_ORIENTATION=
MLNYFDKGNDASAFRIMGNTLSVACGRLAYIYGLQGPCLSLD